jgi:hypothetical protein
LRASSCVNCFRSTAASELYHQRKIKRKEYHTSAAFAADVELVFSNAMAFNQDHTVIWEDALALRVCFPEDSLLHIEHDVL